MLLVLARRLAVSKRRSQLASNDNYLQPQCLASFGYSMQTYSRRFERCLLLFRGYALPGV